MVHSIPTAPPDGAGAETPVPAEFSATVVPSVSTELRRRRELLGISQADAARRSGVSRNTVSEVEAGKRSPSVRIYEKLRAALGLTLAAAPALLARPAPASHTEGQRAMLAEANGVSIAAVREHLSLLGERLGAVGLAAIADGDDVRLMPQDWAKESVSRVTVLEVQHALTDAALEVFVIVGLLGSAKRREIEDRRGGEDGASLLERMCRRSLLEKARDNHLRGDPYVSRLTAVALGALGHATLESVHDQCCRRIGESALSS